ncbi:hypothetical protein, partial [Mesorhizobium sp. M0208]|uniref:hypothetical protein n=1 Tax=Mesorhizobium sp. M0208 TaxID=2956916 RepID=UPI003336F01A
LASNASVQITRRSESKCGLDCQVFRGVQLLRLSLRSPNPVDRSLTVSTLSAFAARQSQG